PCPAWACCCASICLAAEPSNQTVRLVEVAPPRHYEQPAAARQPSEGGSLLAMTSLRRLRVGPVFEAGGDRIVDPFEEDELEFLAHLVRDVFEVLAVARRQHHAGKPRARGRGGLLLDAAHRKHKAAQADLAGHRRVAANGSPGEQRDQRG